MLKNKILPLIQLTRPHHFTKNLFIFAPIFFALQITDVNFLVKCLFASIGFSIVAGVVYIINDYKDIEDDKKHPKKKFRPLASGKVKKEEAIMFGFVLFIIGCIISYLLSPLMLALMLLYFAMNIAYSFGLKHIAIVDIFIIAVGFIMRVLVGSAVTGIHITNWIIIMVFLLAIFLSLTKRRDDVIIFQTTGKKMRKSMDGYNETFLNAAIVVTSAIVIVAYLMYTTSPEIIMKFRSTNLYITSIFVIFGIFRYMQLTFVETKSGSPVAVLAKDRWIQLSILAWLAAFGLLIYF